MKSRAIVILMILVATASAAIAQKPGRTPVTKPRIIVDRSAVEPKLPTAKSLIAKYVAAIGGKSAIRKFKSRVTTSTVEMKPMGISGKNEVYQLAPNKMYNKLTLGGLGEIVDVFDGKSAWQISPIQGTREKTGDELMQAKMSADFYAPLNYEKLYSKLEVVELKSDGASETYVVKATVNGLDPDFMYFDKATGFLVATKSTIVSPQGKMEMTTTFSDMRAVDGIKYPFSSTAKSAGMEIVINVTEIKHRVKIDKKLFAKPE